MRTCIDQLLALPHIDAPSLKGEVHYLAGRLEDLRLKRTISNEAYLDAGAIQGAIELVANMIDMGVAQTEIDPGTPTLNTPACEQNRDKAPRPKLGG